MYGEKQVTTVLARDVSISEKRRAMLVTLTPEEEKRDALMKDYNKKFQQYNQKLHSLRQDYVQTSGRLESL